MLKRILFVDDEPRVLEGLERMLRVMRHEWSMAFVTSGRDALDALEQQPFDVVVTDMRMPGMDGATLLDHMVERHPLVTRIVLSGHAEHETLMRAAAVAHQYLSKPCDAADLRAKVSETLALRELLSDSRLKELVSQVRQLPSLPSRCSELIDELASTDAAVDRVAAIVERDMGMTAKVLQLANSTFFGGRRRVSSAAEGVQLLGVETIRALVVSSRAFSQLELCKSDQYNVGALDGHSLNVSHCARVIAAAQHADGRTLADATTAGLLHDIGKLVLIDVLAAEYPTTLAKHWRSGQAVWQVEQECFGATHAAVGAYLLGQWGLPDTVVGAVAWHHTPDHSATEAFSALTAVHAGNAIVHDLEKRRNPKRSRAPIITDYIRRLGLEGATDRWTAACEVGAEEGL
jgi:HD-like signal output (HDOD) protein/CheY-like chemotaxis protein